MAFSRKKKILHCSHLHGGAGQELLAQRSSAQTQALLQFNALSFHFFFPISLLFFFFPVLEIPHGLLMAHGCKFRFLVAALLTVSCKHLTRGWVHLQRSILTWVRMDRCPKNLVLLQGVKKEQTSDIPVLEGAIPPSLASSFIVWMRSRTENRCAI